MQRCFHLASLGHGNVSPNPMVGAVIVVEQEIIGEGFTSPYGGAHAEANAVQSVLDKYGEEKGRELLAESVVYVSLEPCAHVGKTPSCARMLAGYMPRRVVIACVDPFEKVAGKGIEILRDAGIPCEIGVEEQEAEWINRRFFTRLIKNRPYIILKWAETKDGFFAPEEGKTQQWISNSASKQLVHRWRSQEDAILIGKHTALADNPSLTTREWLGKNPVRILIDRNLEVPTDADLFSAEAPTIVFNALKYDVNNRTTFIELENFNLYLPQTVMYQLYLMDIQSVIIEGGTRTLQSFIDAGLWDEARVFVSNKEWGRGLKSPRLEGYLKEQRKVATDTLNIYTSSTDF